MKTIVFFLIVISYCLMTTLCGASRVCNQEDISYVEDGHKTRERRSTTSVYNIYLNGTIYTVSKTNPEWHNQPQQSFVVNNGKIVYIGSENGAIDGYIDKPTVKVYDLYGYTVLPGIHDIHMHPLEAMSPVGGTCKLSNEEDPENMIDWIKQCAPNQIGTEWVLGHGHSIHNILEHIKQGGRDPKYILDDAIPDKPAIMMEETSHSVWVNSEALYRAGINKTTGIRPGGIIMRNTTTNEPNGILLENEGNAIMDLALAPTPALDKLNYDGLVEAMYYLSENGITSICDARVYWKRGHLEAWDSACQNNKMSVRAVLGLWAYPHENDDFQIPELKKMYSDSNTNCFLKKSQIKLYSDGLLDSTTAAMLERYDVDLKLQGLEGNIGMNYFEQNRTEKYVKSLQSFDGDKGFDFNIHAIGDRGVRETLNALENAYNTDTRHRLTHLEQVNATDIPRFQTLNAIADVQVAGNFTLPDYITTEISKLVGSSRASAFIPIKSIKDTGAVTTFSSDWDVSPLNPFIGMQHALERGDQSVTLKDAVEMYTINPAFVMRQENIAGSLEVGKAADFIIVNQDIFKIDPINIQNTLVLHTVLNGDTMHTKWTGIPDDITSQYIKTTSCSNVHFIDVSCYMLYIICLSLFIQ